MIKNISFIKNILISSLPLVLFQLCELGLGVIDTIMVSSYNIELLPAVNISASYYIFVIVIIAGFSFPFSAFFGQFIGAKRKLGMHRVALISIFISISVSILGALVIIAGIYISKSLGYEQSLYENIKTYLSYRWYDVFFIAFAINFRFFLQNHGMHNQLMIVGLLMLPINILFNYILIYGFGFIPEMGIKGAAIATMLTNLITVLFLVVCYVDVFKKFNYKRLTKFKVDFKLFKFITKMGVFSAIALVAEGGIVALTSIIAGKIGHTTMVVHSIYIVFLNIFFAYIFGFSQYVNTKVAILAGEGKLEELKRFSFNGFFSGFFVVIIFLFLMFLYKNYLFDAFFNVNDNIKVIISDKLLFIFIICVVSQYLQVFSGAFMRALNLNNAVFLNYVVGIGFVGIPILYLSKYGEFQLGIIWIGVLSAFFLVTFMNIVYIIGLIKKKKLLNRI